MANSTFSQQLVLLPKLDSRERTSLHVEAQKAFAKFYASEGRTYVSSWRDECHSNVAESNDDVTLKASSKTPAFDFGTPVMLPRVKKVPRSVLSVGSASKQRRRLKIGTKTLVPVDSFESSRSKKRNAHKGEKAQPKVVNKTRKPKQSRENRDNASTSEGTAAERLRERRERKRAKRTIMNPPPDSKEEAPSIRKKSKEGQKIPVGFALMHGFNATNVGKKRLTVKPSVSIGVFNKGKASAKAKPSNIKGTSRNDRILGYFSESRFLNKARSAMTLQDDSSSVSASSNASVNKVSRKRKAKFTLREDSEVNSVQILTSPPKESKAPSILWDIELGKSLCSDKPSMSILPTKKPGSVVVDVTGHSWANPLAKGHPDRNITGSVDLSSRPNTGTKGDSEVHASICPSQSASQIIAKATLRKNSTVQEHRSKYFPEAQSENEIRPNAHMESSPPCEITEGNIIHMPEEPELPTYEVSSFGYIPETSPLVAPNPKCNLRMDQRLSVEDISLVDALYQEPGSYLDAEYADVPLHPGYDIMGFDQEYNHFEHDIPISETHRNGFFLEAHDDQNEQDLKGHSFSQGLDLVDDSIQGDPQPDYFSDNAADGDLDIFYDFDRFQSNHEESYEQEGSMASCCGYEDMMAVGDPDEDCESMTPSLSMPSDEEDIQVYRFSQGRALLSGYPLQDVEQSDRIPSRYSRLPCLEADVAKSLRGHWHPQRL